MPGLSFANSQTQQRRPGRWWIPVVLIILSVALITLSVRFDNGGPFAVARDAVQSVTKPVQVACSGLSTPFKSLQNVGTSDEVAQLEQENEQLQTLVAELEEYRQQDQRLTSLIKLSDTYGLEYTSAEVVGTTSGWNRTATINKGSADGIQVGMGVMSSCGLYGQVESVTENQSVVRLVNDANSSVSAMVQSSRARGILTGSYDGTLTLSYVSVEKKVGEGDIVISSGQGGTYPRGLVIGTVKSVDTDSSKLYYRITVDPIYNIDSCEEVMVLTGNESSTQSLLDEKAIEQIRSGSTASVSSSSSSSSSDASADSSSSASASSSSSSADSSTSSSSSSDSSSSSSSSSTSSSGSSSSSSSSSSTDNNGNQTENLTAKSSSGGSSG